MKKTRDILLVTGAGIVVLSNSIWFGINIDLGAAIEYMAASFLALVAWLILLTAAIFNLFIKKLN